MDDRAGRPPDNEAMQRVATVDDWASRFARLTSGFPLSARLGIRAAARFVPELVKVPMLLAAAAETTGDATPGRPDPPLTCVPSAEWRGGSADVVVVGSGAGGAVVAKVLAEAGMDVVVVEEGRRHTAEEFRRTSTFDRFRTLYRDSGATVALGLPPVVLPLGRGVGGTTLVNSGTCFRTPDRVLRRWREQWGVPTDEFPELLDAVERMLHVAPQPLDVLGRNGLLAIAGASSLGWDAQPLNRNAPGCAGSCQCAVGCPRNAKNGVHLNALPDACRAGARIVTEARVTRVITARRRAEGVLIRRPDGSSFVLRAPLVVVAAGATETPPLLRRSGLGGQPGLGRGMAVHPATTVAGRFDEPVNSSRGVLQSVGIERFHDEGILIEATTGPAGLVTFPLPGTGRELRHELDNRHHLAYLGAMVADAPAGQVLGRHRPVITYQLTRADAGKLRKAMVEMGRVLFAAGATEVLTGLDRHPRASTVEELAEIVGTTPAKALRVAAFHPTGTARMGADGQRAPVDVTGRLRGVYGVYIADGSCLPTCPEVNPQVTIMAVAMAVANGIRSTS
ncbi:GMC family oxidoreductase [Actinocrispum wychmicini]|uniref:GMC family oxidoreductase n=1 Tax=Actinocrispum wychmicini TaxID=1213861 RepID=UPI001A9EFBED|nr:GMC family oxidoreductase [Actinocrispum wychmicini]